MKAARGVKRISVLFARIVMHPTDLQGETEEKREADETASRQRKLDISGAIDVAGHPRRPLNFRSASPFRASRTKKLLFILPFLPFLVIPSRRRKLQCHAIFLSEHRRAATRQESTMLRQVVSINKCI